jgi:tryptophanyl-tRNA synthetase
MLKPARATLVPVGEDQKQHLELTRDIGYGVNSALGKALFVLPHHVLTPTKRLMSLRTPTQKMSKSDPSPDSRIDLSDSAEDIVRKIRKATTDSHRHISYDPETRPGVSNLISMYMGVLGIDEYRHGSHVKDHFGDCNGMGDFKLKVSDVINTELNEIRRNYARILKNGDEYVEDILTLGEQKARDLASENLDEIKQAFGL